MLGSAGPDLLRQSSETLAGRIAYHELTPFRVDETGVDAIERLWVRGGFPSSFLAVDDAGSVRWRNAFIRTLLERDLPQLGVSAPAATMRRFWTMVAHYHGGHWKNAEIGRALGVSGPTINTYLDTLTDALVVRRLAPWYENLKKRQVKAPGSMSRTPGCCTRCSRSTPGPLSSATRRPGRPGRDSPCRSASGFSGRTGTGATTGRRIRERELDLLVFQGGRRIGFEFKRTSAPRLTRSMHSALTDLTLDRLFVVFPGDSRFPLRERVEAVGLNRACAEGF